MKEQIVLWFAGILSVTFFAACASPSGSGPSSVMPPDSHRLEYPEPEEPRSPLRFLVVGDTQNPKPGEPQNDAPRQAIYGRLAAALKDSVMVVHLGDLVENGSREWQWRQFFDGIFWEDLPQEQRRMFFPIPGNHEYKTNFFDYGGGDLSLYFARFPHLQKQRYYFFTRGDACFVAMDAGRNGIAKWFGGERWQNGVEEQVAWLEEVVLPQLREWGEQRGVRRVFVFFHKPAYATPLQVKNRQSAAILERFDDFNRDNGYRFQIFAFAGHIHTFSHIVRDYNGDGVGEIDQFTVGTGGGTQRGGQYFRKVERWEDLDRYRREKYQGGLRGEGLDQELFDRLRLDDGHFGYLEVIVAEEVTFVYHRFDPEVGGFSVDYEFGRYMNPR